MRNERDTQRCNIHRPEREIPVERSEVAKSRPTPRRVPCMGGGGGDPSMDPSASCSDAVDCHGHGSCRDTAAPGVVHCKCEYFWSGPMCNIPFAEMDWCVVGVGCRAAAWCRRPACSVVCCMMPAWRRAVAAVGWRGRADVVGCPNSPLHHRRPPAHLAVLCRSPVARTVDVL